MIDSDDNDGFPGSGSATKPHLRGRRSGISNSKNRTIIVEKVRKRSVRKPSDGSKDSASSKSAPTVMGMSESEYNRRMNAVKMAADEKEACEEVDDVMPMAQVVHQGYSAKQQTSDDEEVVKTEEAEPKAEVDASGVTEDTVSQPAQSEVQKVNLAGEGAEEEDAQDTQHSRKNKGSWKSKDSQDRGYDDEGDFSGDRDNKKGTKSSDGKGSLSNKRSLDRGRRQSGRFNVARAIDDDDTQNQRSLASIRRRQAREKRRNEAANIVREKIIRDVQIPDFISVQDLSARMSEKASDVIKTLMQMGMIVTITQLLDGDTAQLVVEEMGHRAVRVSESDVEEGLGDITDINRGLMTSRPPIVTVMGHVDHGKTSLLDYLRNSNTTARETGGITQHIGAYSVCTAGGGNITFLDTPGHMAFTMMRSRGAQVTDISVLVVAADDGVMPQTIEAINHAKAADTALIVAITKVDKPGSDPQKIRTQLLNHSVILEELGGDTLSFEVSSKTGEGIDKLLEGILLVADMMDLKATSDGHAQGTVIEAKLESGRGPVASILVQEGKLKVGDVFVVGRDWGRVRALIDSHGDRVNSATPSFPVEIIGLQSTPEAGDILYCVASELRAKAISSYRQRKAKDNLALIKARGSLDQLLIQSKDNDGKKELRVIVKADVQGSLGAIRQVLEQIRNDEVYVRILHEAAGGITETDVNLADASKAIIVAFNTKANVNVREFANRRAVNIMYYSVIFNLADEIRQMAAGLMGIQTRNIEIGKALVQEVFNISKVGNIAGCMVTDGYVRVNTFARVVRAGEVIVRCQKISKLKRYKSDIAEVKNGYECGICLENFRDIRKGDVLECFEIEEFRGTL